MTQTGAYRADVRSWKDEPIIGGTGPGMWESSSFSTVTPSWQVLPAQKHEVSSIEETDAVISLLKQGASRAFEAVQRQILHRSQEWVGTLEAAAALEQIKIDLGVERELVLRMPPYARRTVRVRVKYTGPAKPKVVYDLLPEDEDHSRE